MLLVVTLVVVARRWTAMQHIILCVLVYDSGMCFNLNPSHIVTSVLHVCGIRTEPNTKRPTRSI